MVLAGLVAEGTTEVAEITSHREGLRAFRRKIRGLGGDIERVEE